MKQGFNYFYTLMVLLGSIMLNPAAWADANSSSLEDFDGAKSSISQYAGKGKWLVVMLWASDCPVCNKEASNYQALHDKHKNKDAQVLGISLDGQAKLKDAKDFVKRHAIKFPNLIDEPQHIAKMYQDLTGEAWIGTPTFMVYNPKGELLGSQIGAVPTKVIESFIASESH
jgi:peroxiredoxin